MAMSVSDRGGGNTVACASMESVLAEAGFPRVDLLKCDIEGAEAAVFSHGSLEWLMRTRCVLIELHGADAARAVHAACAGAGLRFITQYRATHLFSR
jgi:hypothetical protein